MELVFDYMKDDILRHRLNALTQKTFGFDFEDWVAGGYFEGDYIPYSYMEDGKILANVSANRMNFLQNGVRKNYIQIGTVMTDESFRKQGLARKLVEHVFEEYEGQCDGFYLFSNSSALGFYRKTGFTEGVQYHYILNEEWSGRTRRSGTFQKVDQQDRRIKLDYMDAVRNCAVNSALEQTNKFGLQMFYTADLSGVYYAGGIDCFAVMEQEEDTLILQSIISKRHIPMQDIIAHIDARYRYLELGFPPCGEDAGMFEISACDDGDDDTLFYKGKDLERLEREKLIFPQLSRA